MDDNMTKKKIKYLMILTSFLIYWFSEWEPGECRIGICGSEAACLFNSNGSKTHMCICPHDSSRPTKDLQCPNRNTGRSKSNFKCQIEWIWKLFSLILM